MALPHYFMYKYINTSARHAYTIQEEKKSKVKYEINKSLF